jgi:N-acetylglucosamine-6-phosphate deacetylase
VILIHHRPSKIVTRERINFQQIDCHNAIIAPGYIDLQINGKLKAKFNGTADEYLKRGNAALSFSSPFFFIGGYGVDFSYDVNTVEVGVAKVSKGLLAHGVTSFCPTLVTSPTETYQQVLPQIKKREGGKHGATVLGVHVEGPFISIDKKGAHPAHCIREFDDGFRTVEEVYGDISNISIITLAPEKQRAPDAIDELVKRNITVSLGHSMADLSDGETAVKHGATLITHLFNAMLPVSLFCFFSISLSLIPFVPFSSIIVIQDLSVCSHQTKFPKAKLSISELFPMEFTRMAQH